MSLQSLRCSYPVTFGVAVAACVVAANAALPVWDNAAQNDLAHTGAAAVLVAVLYVVSGGSSLPASLGKGIWQRRWPAVTAVVVFALVAYAAVVCIAGFVAGARTAVLSPSYLGLLALSCVATGVFEEGLFRGFLFEGFAQATGESLPVGSAWKAAVATSVLFALLHVLQGNPASAFFPDAVWVVFKLVEATAFGLAMCYLRLRGFSVWTLAALHAGFDFLYFL